MDEEMEEILRKMGWTSGFHFPVANDENKALQQEVEQLILRKAKATVLYRNEEARFNSIEKHLKIIKEQSEENQVLKIIN